MPDPTPALNCTGWLVVAILIAAALYWLLIVDSVEVGE